MIVRTTRDGNVLRLLSSLWVCCEEENIEEETPPEEIEIDGDSGQETPPEPVEPQGDSGNDDQPYYGSKELNPDGRPLRLDTSILSPEEVDNILEMEGDSLFLTDEEIAAREDGAGAKGKKEGPSTDDDSGEENDDEEGVDDEEEKNAEEETDESEEATDEDDSDVKEFFKSTGLSREDFNQLPEGAQKKLVDLYQSPGNSKQLEKVQKEFNDYRENTETTYQDPVIAARLEELATGQAYVAREVPPITVKEMDAIDDLLSQNKVKEAQSLINKAFKDRVESAVQRERAVLEQKVEQKADLNKAFETFRGLGKLDKRFAIKETDPEKLVEGHPEYQTVTSGDWKGIKDYCVAKGWNLKQIGAMTPKELYSAYSAAKGWDRERDAALVKKGERDFLKRIKNPKKVARTLGSGKRSGNAGSGSNGTAFNRQALFNELVENNGRSATYARLLERHGGNDAVREQLESVFFEANERVQRERENSGSRRTHRGKRPRRSAA